MNVLSSSSVLARKVQFLASDALQEMMKKFPTNINDAPAFESQESDVDEDNGKKLVETNESNDQSSEEFNANDDDDSEVLSPTFVDINDRKFSSNSEEN